MARAKVSSRSQRFDPLGQSKSIHNHKHVAQSRKETIKLLAKLSSPVENERIEAASAVASMLHTDPANQQVLLKEKGVSLLLSGLTDNSYAVISLCSGILHTLLENDEGDIVSEALVRHDGTIVLQKTLERFSKLRWDSEKKLEPQQDKYAMIAIGNILAIYSELCQASTSFCARLLRENYDIVYTAEKFITHAQEKQSMPDHLDIASVKLLTVLIESSAILSCDVRGYDHFMFCLETKEPCNIDAAPFNALAGIILLALLSNNQALSVTARSIFARFDRFLSSVDCFKSDASVAICEFLLQQLAVISSSTNFQRQNDQDDVDMVDEDDDEHGLQSCLGTLIPSLLPVAVPMVVDAEEANQYPADRLSCHILAMDILHNVFWSAAILASQFERDACERIWQSILDELALIVTLDEELANSTYSLLYAIATNMRGEISSTKEGVMQHIKLYQTSLNAELQMKIIGLLGCLASTPAQQDVNRAIGTLLVTVICSLPRSDADSVIEACNAIFEIYADAENEYESIFRSGKFLKHLQNAVPKLDIMLRSVNKGTQPELFERASDAFNNMCAFIEYKQKEL